jgi:hypothetical protein
MLEDGIFEIRLDYKASTGSADRVFLVMAEYVSAFEDLIHVVGHSIDPEASYSYQLSSVENGSIKGILNCKSALKTFSKALSKIPENIASSRVDLDEIDSEEDIDCLARELERKVKDSIDIKFPNQPNIDRLGLAEGVKRLVDASGRLVDGETIELKSNESKVIFLNTKVRFDKDPSSLFIEMFKEIKETETLLIKKSTFVGDAMWDFKSIERGKTFSAPITDEQWLKRFQNRKLTRIDPGDAIIALVSYEANKAKGAKKFTFSNHKVIHVERLMKSDELQAKLDLDYDSEEA